jgi:hypothetical protein
MGRTIDKIFLGFLVILLVALSGVFITALSNDEGKSSQGSLTVKDVVPEKTNFLTASEVGEDYEENEVVVSGSALEKASAAALAYLGEGRVTDSEIGDEEGYYEIEVTLDNGDEVDVHLDENFKVTSTEYEDDEDDD